MRKSIYAMTMAVSMMLASCSKNDTEQPKEEETPMAQISQSALIGKWELASLDWIYYTSAGKEDHSSSYTNSKPDDPKRSWITFNSDKTYIHMGKDAGSVGIMLADALPYTSGEWALSNGNKTIKLQDKEWNATKFANNQMQIEYNTTSTDGAKSKVILLFQKN